MAALDKNDDLIQGVGSALRDDDLVLADFLVSRGGGAPLVVDLTLRVLRGDLACLLGSNGAGKATTLRAIRGSACVVSESIAARSTDPSKLRTEDRPHHNDAHFPEGRDLGVILTRASPTAPSIFDRSSILTFGVVIIHCLLFCAGLYGVAARVLRATFLATAPPPAKTNSDVAVPLRHPVNPRKDVREEAILTPKNLSKSFGGLQAVKDVSFDGRQGEVLGLIGPDGAGKSSLVDLLTGAQQAGCPRAQAGECRRNHHRRWASTTWI